MGENVRNKSVERARESFSRRSEHYRQERLLRAGCADCLNNALFRSLFNDLPNLRSPPGSYYDAVQEGPGTLAHITKDWETRRPDESEVQVELFRQVVRTGPARKSADFENKHEVYTVVISHLDFSAVYFGKCSLAYMINQRINSNEGLKRFKEDLLKRKLASRAEANRYD